MTLSPEHPIPRTVQDVLDARGLHREERWYEAAVSVLLRELAVYEALEKAIVVEVLPSDRDYAYAARFAGALSTIGNNIPEVKKNIVDAIERHIRLLRNKNENLGERVDRLQAECNAAVRSLEQIRDWPQVEFKQGEVTDELKALAVVLGYFNNIRDMAKAALEAAPPASTQTPEFQ